MTIPSLEIQNSKLFVMDEREKAERLEYFHHLHCHSDIVHRMFLINALLMLVTLPFVNIYFYSMVYHKEKSRAWRLQSQRKPIRWGGSLLPTVA